VVDEMVLTVITIKAEPETDTAYRAFGKAIDQTLNPDFPTTQPDKLLKNPDGSVLSTKSAFTHVEILDLPEGDHTIKFAPSSPSGYTWKARVIINRLTDLGEQTGLTSTNQYSATFTVRRRTQQEIRKAIAEADRYIRRLVQTFTWTKPDGTKTTYAMIKSCPGLPICIKIDKWYQGYCYNGLLGPDYPYDEHSPLCIHSWHATCYTESVVEPKYETCEATIVFGFDNPLPNGGMYFVKVARVYVKYGPDPSDPTKMKITIKLLDWYVPDIHGDIYFGTEPDPNNPGAVRPRKIIANAQWAVGTEWSESTESWGCFPSISYWAGETLLAAHYLWGKLLRRDWAKAMFNFLDDYGFSDVSVRAPSFLGTQINYPDNWLCLTSEHGRACDIWATLPRNEMLSSHWSTLCGPGARVFFADEIKWLGTIMTQGRLSCLYEEFNLAIPPLAIYSMSKYNDPTAEVAYIMYGSGSDCDVHVSAEKLLMTGYTSCTCGNMAPYKEWVYKVLKDDPHADGDVTIWRLAEALVAYTMLGYGFGYEEAQKIADALADFILDLQWGVKPGEEGIGRLWVNYQGTPTGFTVNRPDHRGGFYHRYEIRDCKVYWRPRPPRDPIQQFLIDGLGWEPPGGIPLFTPTSVEGTIVAVMALRIYDAYRFRLGGS
jgi:hypothetical protein